MKNKKLTSCLVILLVCAFIMKVYLVDYPRLKIINVSVIMDRHYGRFTTVNGPVTVQVTGQGMFFVDPNSLSVTIGRGQDIGYMVDYSFSNVQVASCSMLACNGLPENITLNVAIESPGLLPASSTIHVTLAGLWGPLGSKPILHMQLSAEVPIEWHIISDITPEYPLQG